MDPSEDTQNDKTRLISLPEAADRYGFNPKYMAQLASRGRLKATKIGGIWLTTKEDVETYIRSRQRRGAYRKDVQVD